MENSYYRYSRSAPFEGDPERAWETASNILMGNHFQVMHEEKDYLEFVGTVAMTSTQQSPLMGATRIRLTRREHSLLLIAELGGVQAMTRFLVIFLTMLMVALAALILALKGLSGAMLVLLPFVPWLVLVPLMARMMRQRTVAALDTLLANIAQAGAKVTLAGRT